MQHLDNFYKFDNFNQASYRKPKYTTLKQLATANLPNSQVTMSVVNSHGSYFMFTSLKHTHLK